MRTSQTICFLTGVSFSVMALRPAAGEAQAISVAFRGDEVVSCLLEPSRRIAVSTTVQGLVRHVRFERGDRVSAGSTLLELDMDVERAQHDLSAARADFARRRLSRNRSMIAGDMLSAHERDELVTELRIAELETGRARLEMERRVTRSPVTGVIADRRIQPGEFASTSPFAELVVLDTLHIEMVLKSEVYGRLAPGMALEVELGPPVQRVVKARIAIVDAVIDPASITFRVRAVLPNGDGLIPAGINCRPVSAGDAR